MIKPSKYQEDIFNFVKNDFGRSGLVEAVPGSGKTTTIVMASQLVKGTSRFIAFNKHIAEELSARLPTNCQASTIHSLGFGLCRSQLGTKKLDEWKISNILTEIGMPKPFELKGKEKSNAIYLRKSVEEIISIAKSTLCKPEELVAICEFYNVDIPDYSLIDIAIKALEINKDRTHIVNFDDMFWLPIVNDCRFPQYDLVFVDETQDVSSAQFEFIKRFHSRTIAVGDRYQSLYGFRGANPQAMDEFKTSMNAFELPLSICYRCPKSVVRLAQTIVPHIEFWEGSEEGLVKEIKYDEIFDLCSAGDMILCRYNAPLVQMALSLLSKKIKVSIKGRDIGANLATIAEKFFNHSTFSFEEAIYEMDSFFSKKKHKSETAKNDLDDKKLVIQIIAKSAKDEGFRPFEVPAFIRSIFSDETASITLSSIHRAKGLEADRVFLMRTPVRRSQNSQEWELQQERNCIYVAYTRAKRCLYLTDVEVGF